MKKILILGAGEMQIPIIQKCRELGFKTIVTDFCAKAPGFQFASVPLIVDTLDKKKTLAVAKENHINGILTTSDAPVASVAYVCDSLGLFGINSRGAKISTDKYLQRSILKKNGLKIPKFLKTKNLSDLEKCKKWNLPLVCKPVDSSASRGVIKVNSLDELNDAFLTAKKASRTGRVILEEFIEGKEYSVEAFTQHGKTHVIAITEKSVIPNEFFFVEERHVIPANLTNEATLDIIEYVKTIIKIFELNNTASHIELMYSEEEGPILIELGARLGGDYITSDLVPLATGVDMLKNQILLSIGENIEEQKTLNYFAGIQFLHKVNYKKALKTLSMPNTYIKKDIRPYSNLPIRSSLDRLGYVIFRANTRDELLDKLDFK